MRNSTLFSILAVTGLAVLSSSALPAVQKDKTPQHQDPYLRGPADESTLIKEVRHNLLMLPYFGVFDDLGFNVNGSTVTLTGQVTKPTLKSDADGAVKKVPGVTNVVNNIEVLPLSPMDDQTRIATYRAIYGDPSLATRYGYSAAPSIHIIVKNGNVRLEGVVANTMDKQVAETRAKTVANVFNVQDDLQVEGK
jgi:hyperosmotically inducible periplasmic protein